MEIESIKTSAIKVYDKNARTHSPEQVAQLVNSIKEFGFVNLVLVDENNVLIAGHGRTAAAKQMKMAEVPAIRICGLTEAQKKALRLADNKLAENAERASQEAEANLRASLPQELQSVPIAPTEQPKLSGNDEVAYNRIIIVYKASEVEELKRVLRLREVTQVVYNLDDIKNAQY